MRLWSKREEDSEDEAIPAPVGIDRIMEYGMDDGEVPTVTKPDDRIILSSGLDLTERLEGIRVRGEDGEWTTL